MGILGFYEYFKKTMKVPFESGKISMLSGQKLAVDSNAFVYRFTARGDTVPHFITMYTYFLQNNVELYFCFDGKPHPKKKAEVEKRKKRKEEFKQSIQQDEMNIIKIKTKFGLDPSKNIDELDEAMQQEYDWVRNLEESLQRKRNGMIVTNPDEIKRIQETLRKLGATVIIARDEGEALCATLNRLGIVDGVLADDSDVFPFGAKKVIRGWTENENYCDFKIYTTEDILRENNLTHSQLVDICTLCKNDFDNNAHVKGLGIANAAKLITKFTSLEKWYYIQTNPEPVKEEEIVFEEKKFQSGKRISPKRKREEKIKRYELPDGFQPMENRSVFQEYLDLEQVPVEIPQPQTPTKEEIQAVIEPYLVSYPYHAAKWNYTFFPADVEKIQEPISKDDETLREDLECFI